MIGLYLLAPILSKWVEGASKRQLQFVLLLWTINLLFPYLNLLSPDFFDSSGSHYWMLNYFGGFVGYFLLGHYLHRYPVRMGWNREWLVVLSGLVIYICVLGILKMRQCDIVSYFMNYLQIGIALIVAFCIIVAQRLSAYSWTMKWQNIINPLARYSFGIYLIHPMIVRDLVWSFFVHHRMPALPETFAIAIISMLLSYGILRILSCLPKSKYIVGC